MRRLISLACLAALLGLPSLASLVGPLAGVASAQPPAGAQPQPGTEVDPEEPTPPEVEGEEEEEAEEPTEEEPVDEEPRLRAPTVEPIDLAEPEEEAREEDVEASVEDEAEDDAFPSPADAAAQLEDAAPQTSDPTQAEWTAPAPILTLHGYFRVRSELWDSFHLGRVPVMSEPSLDRPFSWFRPLENQLGDGAPAGGCGDTGSEDSMEECDTETLGFANMRLRLEPTISLSDDVRVHMQFDVLDNVVLGSTPGSFVTGPSGARGPVGAAGVDDLRTVQAPPSTYRNGVQDSIRVRRAWAEVTNRGLGQLRFGRMGSHWGLGILQNGGEGIDSDFQTDIDRIMGITKLAGFYLMASWDFADEGQLRYNLFDDDRYPWDAGQDDDLDQYTFAVARRMDEETQEATLQRGDPVLNGGLQFIYRSQLLSSRGIESPYAEGPMDGPMTGQLSRRNAEAFIPDAWVQFLYKNLRVELEAVLVAGSIENTDPTTFDDDADRDLLQFGAALESEYRLLDEKLGIYFYTGLATGDNDVEQLVAGDPANDDPDDTLSTFRFHPNYRVDLILWRNVMKQIAGAYYFKPGISYDFIRNSFGQIFGLRADLIWSRAMKERQTWGNERDLGVEINARLYYRSEDGPDLLDGFYGSLEYGILFPLGGLGYAEGDVPGDDPDLSNAQIVRLLLGVQY